MKHALAIFAALICAPFGGSTTANLAANCLKALDRVGDQKGLILRLARAGECAGPV